MITYPSRSSARILLAEDDRPTAKLIQVGLERTGLPHHLNIVHDGDQAIAALEQKAVDLLLLDLHMPGKNGFEVLEYVKQREHLRRTPVVMFSSSELTDDVNRAYDLHANAYVLKPAGLPELCRTLDSILRFWLQTAITPFEIGSDLHSRPSHCWKTCRTEE
jgi:two-component system, chemotaxis family, response regulator Rcp1